MRAEYKEAVKGLQARVAELGVRKIRASAIACGGGLAGATMVVAAMHGKLWAIAAVIVSWGAALVGLRILLRARAAIFTLVRRMNFYERGLARIEGRWRGTSSAGLEFAQKGHLYQDDLEILGEGSLFELLATTRTQVGAERLADYLLDSAGIAEAHARQDAVKELRGATMLREEIALLGKYAFMNCEGQHVREWLETPVLSVAAVVPGFLLVSGGLSLALILCGYAKIFLWLQVVPLLAPLLAAQALIGLWLRNRVRVGLKALLPLRQDIAVLGEGVELLERQQFKSAQLCELVRRVKAGRAARSLRGLGRLLTAVERRDDVVVYGFSLWFAAGTQLVLAAERWRAAHQIELESWLEAWAEFEALNAVACYAYEHEEDVFPELVEVEACFEANALRHPLLRRAEAVGNDVALGRMTSFYLISGSNMAGKSTLLRAMGLNAVLAAAGAPVSALQARMSVFSVCASISIVDSRAEGKSKFLAEVERLRAAIAATAGARPVLFLIDEILSGTNSQDRKLAAEAVMRELIAGGALGAMSTHDLALTQIAEDASLRGVNVHMQSEDAEAPLAFDYRLKPGILQETNGLAIVRMLGISI